MINSFLKGLDKFQIAFHFATSIFILWKFCAAKLHLKNINLILPPNRKRYLQGG